MGVVDLSESRSARSKTARIAGRVVRSPGASHRSRDTSCRAFDRSERELGVIEDVERFRPELNRLALGDREVLEDSHVKVEAGRITDVIPTCIAEGKTLRQHERARVNAKLGIAR